MRQKLSVMSGERTTFRGQVERFGARSGWKGSTEATILLVNVTDTKGKLLCDHLWFTLTKGFRSLELTPGDIVQFDARVSSYSKGHRGWFYSSNPNPDWPLPEEDYKLSYPTKIKKVGHHE